MRNRSIRTSLLLGTVLAVLAVLGVAGAALDRSVRGLFYEQIDRELEGKILLLASSIEWTEKGLETGFDEIDLREFESGEDPSFLLARVEGGDQLYRSPDRADVTIEPAPTPPGEAGFRDLRLADGRGFRIIDLTFRPNVDIDLEDLERAREKARRAESGPGRADREVDEDELAGSRGDRPADEEPAGNGSEDEDPVLDDAALAAVPAVTLTLARDTAAVERLLSRFRWMLVFIGLGAAGAAALLLGVAVRRSLRPLERLAREIARLDEEQLSVRVASTGTPAELEPVVRQLNRLLADLESAFRRERTFSSDVAHELRTPLAGLRSTLEVELSRPREAIEYREAMEQSLPIVCRMQDMVETLLQLARLEAGTVRVRTERVDLVTLLRELWVPLEAAAAVRGLAVDWELPPEAWVVADAALTHSALRNLLENAVAHADADGRILVQLRSEHGRQIRLRIANSGRHVESERVPELFERFFRLDRTRDASEGHFGLGLALVRRISDLLGLALDVRAEEGEFRVDLSFVAPV